VTVNEQEHDLISVRLPRWGRVRSSQGVVPWLLVDEDGRVVEPAARFLKDLVARDASPSSVRSYAYVLLRWWRWLLVVDMSWDRATSAEVRDLVLWLARTTKPNQDGGAPAAPVINPITGKQQSSAGYQPRTIRHNNAVLRSLYDFCLDRGDGPIVNPVHLDRLRHVRLDPGGNSANLFRPGGRIRYNPKVPKQRPREVPDEHWVTLFGSLTSNRDRAILAAAVSNGSRSAEILGVRCVDLDWGDQRMRVVRKGTRVQQWLPTSSEAFVWIRLYLADLGMPLDLQDPLWWTLRRRPQATGPSRRPLNYEALRAVFRRANRLLGTNWSMHDLRHTAALRMSRDDALSLRDVQTILGHAHLSTTADVYLVEEESQVIRRVQHHLERQAQVEVEPTRPAAESGYHDDDLDVLFGGRLP
jgi:integrase/recombinase XerD